MVVWFLDARHHRASSTSSHDPTVLWALNPAAWHPVSVTPPATRRSSSSARSSSRSPAPRRSMPTSGISAASRSSLAWFGLVFPCLLLNYFGQGAYRHRQWRGGGRQSVLRDAARLVPAAVRDPRHGRDRDRQPGGDHRACSASRSRRWRSISCRASTVLHTSETQSGQIYMPQINCDPVHPGDAAGDRLRQLERRCRRPTASRSAA